ncbi:exodeoxyribonuclease III [candidate division KSB1 bacterium]|nr:exodeoxyribonuclease III [candidate division KSB1 bacterium]
MDELKLFSWNVNGLRAVYKKNFLDWFREINPDILCLQETKAHEDQLPEDLRFIKGYDSFFSSAEKKGYSGVATYSKIKPQVVMHGIDQPEYDSEGRILITDYGDILLYNIYFPNGKASKERLNYKLEFYDAFFDHILIQKKAGRNIVICGDVNTAHREVDLARPKDNEKTSGFLPIERAWIDKFLAHGFVDTFRMFHEEGGHYSWWDLRTRARERNIGWRIDYFYVNEEFAPRVRAAYILPDIMGSDHCPIGLELTL